METKITDLQEQVNRAIERKDYEEADILSRQLCESQGFERLDNVMPEGFAGEIAAKERKDRSMKRKTLTKAAAVVLLLGLSGTTAFAVNRQYKRAYHATYGLSSADEKEAAPAEENNAAEKSYSNPNPETEDGFQEVLSVERGSAETLWTQKKEMRETSVRYASDDGETWEPERQISEWTEYTYPDYAAACKDMKNSGILGKTYRQKGDVIRRDYAPDETGDTSTDLQAVFQYGRGSFTLDEKETKNADGAREETQYWLINSTEPVKNQREYTASNGNVFALSDDEETGKKRTTTMITDDGYSAVFTFADLTEQEIHEILDTVQIRNEQK